MSRPASSVRVTRLNEAIAHEGAALCAALGPRSGQVLATGGEDAAVLVWRLGRPAPLAALREHKRPVTCVAFSAGDAGLRRRPTGTFAQATLAHADLPLASSSVERLNSIPSAPSLAAAAPPETRC